MNRTDGHPIASLEPGELPSWPPARTGEPQAANISPARAWIGCGTWDFGLFIDCLFDTLKDLKLDEATARQVISRLNVYSDEITGSSNGSE